MRHSAAEAFAYLTRGAVDVVTADALKAKLALGRPLTVKVGFDPTAPDIHLGHTVLMRKMKHFQDLGHRVVFVIGDFTGLIGDPSGRISTRPPLTREQIDANAETYKAQVFKILDRDKTEVRFNSEWLGALGSDGFIRLAATYNVARMLERREFRQRFEAGQPIGVHEFLYPLAQAYDSVALEADVELGGTDQLFNLLVGRDLMGKLGVPPQIVMTLPLLEGLDGVEKMSKSLGNYVAVEDPPEEMLGKLMSISDALMWRYWTLCTDRTPAEVDALKRAAAGGERHPMDLKFELARTITADFHGHEAADAAEAHFRLVHQRREVPDEVAVVALPASAEPTPLVKVLVTAALAGSNAEARRLLQQGGVRVGGEVVRDPFATLASEPGRDHLLQVGKRRFVRIRFA